MLAFFKIIKRISFQTNDKTSCHLLPVPLYLQDIQTVPTTASSSLPIIYSSRRKDPSLLGEGGRGKISWQSQAWFWQASRGDESVDTPMIVSCHILRRLAVGKKEGSDDGWGIHV